MFNWIKNLLGIKTAVVEAEKKVEAAVVAVEAAVVAVEKKVEEAAKCGCGRSPSGLCVGLHVLPDDLWAVHADNPVKLVVKEVAAVEEKAEEIVVKVAAKAKKNVTKAAAKVAKPRKAKAPKA